jgi:hypothetical protein
MDFWTGAAWTSRPLKVRNEVIREKNGGKTIFERRENTSK